MTVKEIYDTMDGFTEEQRDKFLNGLFDIFCGLSIKSIISFQTNWDGSRPFAEFVIEQNKVIRMCIDMEVSDIGSHVRSLLGLSPLTMDTEI